MRAIRLRSLLVLASLAGACRVSTPFIDPTGKECADAACPSGWFCVAGTCQQACASGGSPCDDGSCPTSGSCEQGSSSSGATSGTTSGNSTGASSGVTKTSSEGTTGGRTSRSTGASSSSKESSTGGSTATSSSSSSTKESSTGGSSSSSSSSSVGGSSSGTVTIGCQGNDDNCPLGQICDSANTCVAGCTNTHGCGTAPQATLSCKNGQCVIASCQQGFVNCNGNAADGCNVDDQTDVDNCGGCNKLCSSPNSTPTCKGGTCSYACDTGYAQCLGNQGCTTDIATDPNNCGACGTFCLPANGTPSCAAGSCQWQCNSGFMHCETGNSGCETATGGDINNCGACGNQCATTPNVLVPLCTNGVCAPSCDPGYADCGTTAAGQPGKGCSTDLNTDARNCGACGKACKNASRNCVNGACQ